MSHQSLLVSVVSLCDHLGSFVQLAGVIVFGTSMQRWLRFVEAPIDFAPVDLLGSGAWSAREQTISSKHHGNDLGRDPVLGHYQQRRMTRIRAILRSLDAIFPG